MSFRLRNNGPIWLGEFTALTEAGFSNGCSCAVCMEQAVLCRTDSTWRCMWAMKQSL